MQDWRYKHAGACQAAEELELSRENLRPVLARRIRVLIADGYELIQEGLRTMLESQHDVVGAVSDGLSLVEAAARLRPDLIILGIVLPLLSGIDAARRIRKELPRVKLLFLTVLANPDYLREALSAGADGYILKSSTRGEILTAVRSVLAGNTYISSGIVAEDFDVSKWQNGETKGTSTLTARERVVLQMLAEGHTAKEVASLLKVSYKTVAFHRNNLRRKLGVKKTIDLLRRAIAEHLI
jgi:DNA-binding NarL/FixJ family response regulator